MCLIHCRLSSSPHQQPRCAEQAGSVIVWNGHTWHSATLNTSPDERRSSLTSFFGTREWADRAGQRFRDGEALPGGGVGMLGSACLERLGAEHRRFYERSPPPRL